MLKKIFYSFLFFILLLGNKAISEENIYLIENINCFAESTNSAEAKNIAIERAERNAMEILFDRLKINKENVKFITSEVLNRVVDSIRISDEVLTNTKYSSKIDVYFNKEFINYYLNQYNIKNGGVIEKKYLYIPVLKVDNDYFTLMDNIWRDYTVKNINRINSNDVDISNRFNVINQNPANDILINKKSIENPNYNDFLTVLKEQNSNVLIFSIAEYIKNGDNVEITLKEVIPEGIVETKLNMFNKENYDYNELIEDASLKLLQYFIKKNLVNNENKKNENISNKNDNIIRACILQSDINDIVFMKNMFYTLTFVKNFKVIHQTTKESCFDIEIDVDQEKIYSLFKENGILAHFKNNVYYLVYIGM